MKLSRLSPPYCFGFFGDQSPRNLLFRFFRYQTPHNPIASSLKLTAMHYRAISYINLPKIYDEAILAQFVVHHATDSNRTIRVECLRCHHTCQIFKCRFAVGQLSVYCRPTVGRQYTDRLLGELFFTFTKNTGATTEFRATQGQHMQIG